MTLLFCFCIAVSFIFGPVDQWNLTHVLQQSCKDRIGPNSSELISTLLCGARLSRGSLTDWIKFAGVLHLFVVSGLHIHFLSAHLLKFPLRIFQSRYAVTLMLFALTLSCGAQPPVLRASLFFVAQSLTKSRYTNLNSVKLIFMSGVCTLIMLQKLSFSLMMSWAALLLLQVPLNKKGEWVSRPFFMWFGLLPFCISFERGNLIALGLMAPITWLFEFFLFPLVWWHGWMPEKIENIFVIFESKFSLSPQLKDRLAPNPPAFALQITYLLILQLLVNQRVRKK